MQEVLHLVNDFNHTMVHSMLFRHLQIEGLSQKVFIPLKDEKNKGRNHFVDNNEIFYYSALLKWYHKYLFLNKIKFLCGSLRDMIDLNHIDIIHASTLYSDGFIAYNIYKAYNIPYILTVRNTDIYTFYKYRKDLLFKLNKVLNEAHKIIFISNANLSAFKRLKHINHSKFSSKYQVINNGIDDYWINNIQKYSYEKRDKSSCLFIGRFDNNKNVLNLITAIQILREKGYLINLNLVGGGGENTNKVMGIVEKYEWITYHGFIDEKKLLCRVFNNNDFFTMVSHHETFGLVYFEALTQGLPILYTKGQGFDGMLGEKVGESVDSNDISSIVSSLENLINNKYEEINNIGFDFLKWNNVAKKYIDIYESI